MGVLKQIKQIFYVFFGSVENSNTKYDLEIKVAALIDAFIKQQGLDSLAQTQTKIVLHKDFSVSWSESGHALNGDEIAVVTIKQLPSFEMLRADFDVPRDSESDTSKQPSQDIIHAGPDILAEEVIREFQVQSPEFRDLPDA